MSELRTWRNKKVHMGTIVIWWNAEGEPHPALVSKVDGLDVTVRVFIHGNAVDRDETCRHWRKVKGGPEIPRCQWTFPEQPAPEQPVNR